MSDEQRTRIAFYSIGERIVKKKRAFVDAPYGERCMADVTLKDGSLAQCGRYRKMGILCRQHRKIAEKRGLKRWLK